MKQTIEYIKKKIGDYGNISIHLGNLSPSQLSKLEKHFNVKKGFLGYYSFTPKTPKQ
jgi:hypothetical protein